MALSYPIAWLGGKWLEHKHWYFAKPCVTLTNMSAVLCALRGGPQSLPTLERAASVAREHHLPLHLMYAVNLDFMKRNITGASTQIADEEISSMGEFILIAAAEQVPTDDLQVINHVRHAPIHEAIIRLAEEIDADYIVVGQRQAEEADDDHAVVNQFAERIRNAIHAEVIVVQEEHDEVAE